MSSFRRWLKIIVPAVVLIGLWRVYDAPSNNWNGVEYFSLIFALAVYAAVVLRGRLRDIFVIAATIFLGLAGVEAYAVVTEARPVDMRTPGYSESKPILGWGPGHPGVFHQTKLQAKTRRVIYDVDYTVDANFTRAVTSAQSGPTVAFFGDSMTFGTGVPDASTLPQLLADGYDRKIRVLNFGFPGYGPQQFLRALETDMYDPLLHGQARLFVYETEPWHAERSSCAASFMLRAPRYEMVDGKATFRGACYERWQNVLKGVLGDTALFHVFVNPALAGVTREDIELYIGVLARAAELGREKYNAPTLILYLPVGDAYLRRCGCTDVWIVQRMQEAGLHVVSGRLDPEKFPVEIAEFPSDGHPTPVANAQRAAILKTYIDQAHLLTNETN